MLQVVEIADKRIIVSEHYAVEILKTARGMMAEIKDRGSPYNGFCALGSDESGALAALALKVQRAASGQCY